MCLFSSQANLTLVWWNVQDERDPNNHIKEVKSLEDFQKVVSTFSIKVNPEEQGGKWDVRILLSFFKTWTLLASTRSVAEAVSSAVQLTK
jgi:hypothetical protein